jgi:TM2 domain-containing membrane protein YozV
MGFFLGLVRMSLRAGGIEGIILAIVVCTIVAIPLLLLSILWVIAAVIDQFRRVDYEKTTGETVTNEDWRRPQE